MTRAEQESTIKKHKEKNMPLMVFFLQKKISACQNTLTKLKIDFLDVNSLIIDKHTFSFLVRPSSSFFSFLC